MLGVVCCFVCLFLSANMELNLADSSSQAWGGWGIPHLLNPLMLTGLSEDTLSCARAEDTLACAFLPEAVLSEDALPCFLFRRLWSVAGTSRTPPVQLKGFKVVV